METKEMLEQLQGLTIEQMSALYFDGETLREPAYKVYQLNSQGHRYYYRFKDNGEPEFYPSVTTILSQTMPTPPHLTKWIADKGFDAAEAYKMERAAYGTFMHASFEELLINRTYDLDALPDKLKKYIADNQLADGFINYADSLKKDVLSFAQFVRDFDVKPMAVEVALICESGHYAGMIDCPCTMKVSEKSDERTTAIVDFKSGRNGFFEGCELQLHLYKKMFEENFGVHIERLYNFAPKDWRKKPTYTLKDQTDSPNAAKIEPILAIARIEDGKRENIFTHVSGIVSLDSTAELTENVTSLTLAQLVKLKNS